MEILNMVFNVALLVCSVAMVVIVLAQKSKSGGLGAAFGGETSAFSSRGKAAGREAKLQKLTVVLAILIGVFAIAIMIVSQFINASEKVTESFLQFIVR